MRYNRLGSTDIEVSAVAMGCWAFAGDATWGPQDDADSSAAVHAALDIVVTLFDTAEGYGTDGWSESVLGRALKGRRHDAVIATKVSSHHLTASAVQEACEDSLRRLQTDFVDLYQIHWPNHDVPIAETMAALEKLCKQGKVRAIGVCNYGPRDLSDLLAVGWCETNQISYSLIWRASEYEIQPICRAQGIGTICWGPLSQGLLTGKFRSPDEVPASRAATRHFSKDRPQTLHDDPGFEAETFETILNIREIAAGVGQPMAVVSLAWLLHQPGVTAVLAGSRKPEQIEQNALAAELTLSADTLQALSDATADLKDKLGANQDMYLVDANRIR
jgi:aryl-alcohol dehydrogenase-like predicted oxidoreductase